MYPPKRVKIKKTCSKVLWNIGHVAFFVTQLPYVTLVLFASPTGAYHILNDIFWDCMHKKHLDNGNRRLREEVSGISGVLHLSVLHKTNVTPIKCYTLFMKS